jgi:hypothetical protein
MIMVEAFIIIIFETMDVASWGGNKGTGLSSGVSMTADDENTVMHKIVCPDHIPSFGEEIGMNTNQVNS